MQWYYLLQGQRQGPIEDAGLETLVRQGTVQDETLVWREGLTEWHPYGAVKPRPPAPPPQPSVVRSEPAPPKPEPAKPEPPMAKPEPAAPKFEPASPKLESASPKLESASPKFEPASPKPESASPKLESASPKLESASPKLESAKPKPEPGWPEALPFPDGPPPRAAAAALKTHLDAGRLLDTLADGRVIRKVVVVVLKIAAVVAGLAGLLGALSILTNSFHGNVAAALGGILFSIIVLATSVCVAQICWHRSKTVAALPQNSAYVVIPIFSVLSRAAGEAAAAGLGGIGLGACLSLWLSPGDTAQMFAGLPLLSQFPAEGGFLTGLIVLVYLAGSGFAALIVGYLWAECIMLLVDIERNTRRSV